MNGEGFAFFRWRMWYKSEYGLNCSDSCNVCKRIWLSGSRD